MRSVRLQLPNEIRLATPSGAEWQIFSDFPPGPAWHRFRRASSSRSAILDGEIVRPWLDGRDLRDRSLLERKSHLRKLLPRHPKSVLYVDHATSGTKLFQVICDRDMEVVVAKQANARFTPDATTWVKIKNRQYSEAAGRQDFFNRVKTRHA